MDTLGTDTGVGSLTALLESCRDEKSERQFVKQSGYGVGHQFCLRTALLVGGNAEDDVSERLLRDCGESRYLPLGARGGALPVTTARDTHVVGL
jgi:hypothetical protein